MQQFTLANLSLFLLSVVAAEPTVYLIRHGEKPSNGSTGLDEQGKERAQCLATFFGSSSDFKIGYIMAEKPKSSGKRDRPYLTVLPLADALGLTVDTSCPKTNPKCVKNAVKAYTGDGNILICWEHSELTEIAEALGDNNAPRYPDDDFGIIWTLPYPYSNITSYADENCPGLGQ